MYLYSLHYLVYEHFRSVLSYVLMYDVIIVKYEHVIHILDEKCL